ncbi:MAG: hypothetical protein QG596_1941, partial [Actinomycetota bacterium]|nr:hypothetical protein [Actinomycetota bacterium]
PDEAALLAAAEDLMSVAGQIHLRAAQGRPVGDQPGQAPDPPEPPVFLVEEMAGEGIEVIISARSDALVPSMTIGLGGIWAEYLADSVVVPLPATPETVRQALTSLKAFGLLSGQRGAKGADLDALASFASKVGHLLLDYRDPSGRGFDLIELNPVVASHEGAVALDAVAHLA